MPYSVSLPLLANTFFFPHSSLSFVWRSKHCYRQQASTCNPYYLTPNRPFRRFPDIFFFHLLINTGQELHSQTLKIASVFPTHLRKDETSAESLFLLLLSNKSQDFLHNPEPKHLCSLSPHSPSLLLLSTAHHVSLRDTGTSPAKIHLMLLGIRWNPLSPIYLSIYHELSRRCSATSSHKCWAYTINN